jgi:hypothetical protein
MFVYRLQELINEFSEGKLTKFAELCNIPQGTLHSYKTGKFPKPEYLLRIREICRINIDWLLTGEGKKYIQLNDAELQTLDPDPEISILLEKAKQVLTSGNLIAEKALEKNINYFAHAVDVEVEFEQLKKDVIEIKNEISELKAERERRLAEKEAQSSAEKAA